MARLHSSDRRQAGRETCRNIDNLGNAQEDKGDTHRISRDIATEKWTHLQGTSTCYTGFSYALTQSQVQPAARTSENH